MFTKKALFVLALPMLTLFVNAQKTVTINDLKKTSTFSAEILPDAKPAAFILSIENPGKKNLHLVISHKDLGEVVDTTINDGEFMRRFNFEEAMDGRYVVTLESGKEKFSREIELNTVTVRKMKFN